MSGIANSEIIRKTCVKDKRNKRKKSASAKSKTSVLRVFAYKKVYRF